MASVLAPASQPTRPSPSDAAWAQRLSEQTALEELEDNLDLSQPRFSIAIDDEEDGEAPTRLSIPWEDEEQTARSIEIGRHAVNENPEGRFSRGSFGSMGPSDRDINVSEPGLDKVLQSLLDNSIVGQPLVGDADKAKRLGSRLDIG